MHCGKALLNYIRTVDRIKKKQLYVGLQCYAQNCTSCKKSKTSRLSTCASVCRDV